MRIFEHSAYSMMRRFIDSRRAGVILDIGAHVGGESVEMRAAFPHAVIYAFEPSSDAYSQLCERAKSVPGLRPVRAAMSDVPGEAEMLIARNRELNSLLRVSDEGRRQWGAAGETVDRERVRVDTVDAWAQREGVSRIDAMKIDVQGAELRVLQGAEHALSGVTCVYAETHVAELYEGCSTLSDVDLHLRARGFVLHQIHNIFQKGPEHQVSHCDVLWVRREAIDRYCRGGQRSFCNFHSPITGDGGDLATLAHGAMREIAMRRPHARVGVVGALAHVRLIADLLANPPVSVECVVDPDVSVEGARLWNYPVVALDAAMRMDLDAVILISEGDESALWASMRPLADRGVGVVALRHGDHADQLARLAANDSASSVR